MARSNYAELIARLDTFIRKYYLHRMIKGALLAVGLVLLYFFVITLLETQFYFGTTGRKVLFFSFLATGLACVFYWVLIPLSKWLRLGKTISHAEAATIIGKHFQDVDDKLLNILQLKENSSADDLLAQASIDQKTNDIGLVPFQGAIDLRSNRKYLKYTAVPLALLIAFITLAPSDLKDSTDRLINNGQEYKRKAPFDLNLSERVLQVMQYEDYVLRVSADGDVIPDEVYLQTEGLTYRMKKDKPGSFSYTFQNVQKDTEFSIFSGPVQSQSYSLEVLYKPVISGFEVTLDHPAYTGIPDEILLNDGDFIVPQGTKVSWSLSTDHTEDVSLLLLDPKQDLEGTRNTETDYSFSHRIMRNSEYRLKLSNEHTVIPDSISYSISVIPDNHPDITAEEFIDSLLADLRYFAGQAKDDYGLRSLAFHYQIVRPDGRNGEKVSIPLALSGKQNSQFSYTFDLAELDLEAGEQVNYYFEVYDNDGINGSKSTRTSIYQHKKASEEELEQEIEENDKQIKSDLSENKEESKKLKDEFKNLREDILQEKELDWQKKKDLEKLMNKQKELMNKFQQAQENFEENLNKKEELQEKSEELQEKAEKVQELFDEAKNKELEELMEKVQELMDEMKKEEALEKLQELEQSAEEMEFNMERALEMYKQLEVELEMEKQIEELKELAEKQKELGKDTESKEENSSNEENQKKQEEINEEFEKIKEEIEKTKEKNEELKAPKEIPDQQEKSDEIQKQQQQSMQDMKQQQNQKAGEKQQKAGEEMQDMANEMEAAMQQGEQDQQMEDMEMLRQLLENLLTLSFEEETLIAAFRKANTNTPRYTYLTQSQKNIKDDFKVVEDTLRELSTRVYELESFITEKVSDINLNLDKSLVDLEERQKLQASEHQQKAMTYLNDLALMLNESLEKMQKQMAQGQPSAQCNKPGNNPGGQGSVPMDKMTKAQQELNGKMKQQGQKNPGGEGDGGTSAKEFAEMAAQQAAIRKALEAKRKANAEQGKGQNEQLNSIIDEMDKVETDLVNKRLTNEMIQRQEDILTRLLEAEKAERERDFDNKRQAEQGRDIERQRPAALEKYLKEREAEIDVYRTVSPELRSYYKSLVEKYYKELKQ